MPDLDLNEIGMESLRMVAAAISRRGEEVLAHWDRIGELGAEHDACVQFAVMGGWATMVTYRDGDTTDMSGRWAVEVEVLRPARTGELSEDAVQAAGAVIAAVGNNDFAGASRMWFGLAPKAAADCMMAVFGMAVACARELAIRNGFEDKS